MGKGSAGEAIGRNNSGSLADDLQELINARDNGVENMYGAV